jgi:dihydrofolate reductase
MGRGGREVEAGHGRLRAREARDGTEVELLMQLGLEHQDLPARACEHVGRNEPVVARSDHDGVRHPRDVSAKMKQHEEKETEMGRIVVTEFVSLDGVMEDPGGSENFKYGGWSFEIGRGDEGDQFKLDEALEADALLLGRVTYEGFAEAWPSRTGDFADKFNNMPKYVVSSTLNDAEWNNTTVLDGDLAGAVSDLKQRHEGDIVVHGSAQLAQALLDRDLVDELRLMVFPVVLGSGKRFFGATSDKKPLQLADSKTVGEGVEILVYRPAP